MKMKRYLASLLVSAVIAVPTSVLAKQTNLSIGEAAAEMGAGKTTSVKLTSAYLKRIAKIDRAGPKINAILALNPDALAQAAALDRERAAGSVRGPLHGIPILIKDNIESLDPVATTAGSLALKDNITRRDAPLVAKLRAAGAIILGKTNLSEWANIRSDNSTSGWSAVGGLTKNPHILNRNTCGSSAGSGAAMAAGLAAATIGTETDGSIVCPSAINGIVGFKPTVGLVSRRFIVPISHSQDTAGPMTGSVRDAAIMLTAIAGSDAEDPATVDADARRTDYVAGLSADALQGLRIGLIEQRAADPALIAAAVKRLTDAGATIVRVTAPTESRETLDNAEFKVLLVELKADLGTYLSGLPAGTTTHRSLADIIAFNKANAATVLQHFGQDIFEKAELEEGLDDPAYLEALATSRRLAGPDGIDSMLAKDRLDLLIGQTNGPAWVSTLGKGDAFAPPSISQLPAVAGYPHLTVPMGSIDHLPVGLSFMGAKWADALVLRAGYAFEGEDQPLMITPRYRKSAKPKKPTSP